MSYNEDSKRFESFAEGKVKCKKCGHTQVLSGDRVICKWCGYWIYKNPTTEFRYKIKNEIKKNK